MKQNTIRLFIVENHKLVRTSLIRLLKEEMDLDVCGESDSVEDSFPAVTKLKPSMVLLDLGLPGKSGVDAVEYFKANLPDTPILVLTMQEPAMYAIPVMRAGASGYVTKDSDHEILLAAIRTIYNGGTYLVQEASEVLMKSIQKHGNEAPHERLSPREYEVMIMHARGTNAREIASRLHLSVSTVHTYKQRVLVKLGLNSMHDLVGYVYRHRLIE